ncbi:S-4TM family putative pore-forming effector [Mangrovihabitans endophyticus]|uniref:Uncharacterized protein n=1 Tax=Mangrovihabitans endophyticus TaxID=1751298 RepID=A0A8J3FRX8_9ACTN|nr:S-4TM family putative pore-forming effector [Mangrovihabitans endophyticus]GGL13091.1 hypothetical protein GCM10012284_54680 [Mangrovihabitans endophyticus]
MPSRRPAIADRQNSPQILTLVRAMSTAHARALRLERLRRWIAFVVALTSLLAATWPVLTAPVAAAGAVWALLQGAGLSPWVQRSTAHAAVVQELFDVSLFEIEWNTVAVGNPPSAAEISALARAYRGPEDLIVDYYEIGDLPDLSRPLDVLACQMQNLGWGSRVHRRFADGVLAAVIGWALLGVLVGVLLSMSLSRLLLVWYLPALGALQLGLELHRRQRDTATVRSRALTLVRERVEANLRDPRRPGQTEALLMLARRVQDLLFTTRRAQVRVPDWFFLRFRPTDRVDFRREMTELSRLVTGADGAPEAPRTATPPPGEPPRASPSA